MPIEIRIPRLGWSMEEGRFLGWKKRDGERVQIGDVLYELEGEKAIQEVESVDNGTLRIPPDTPKPDTLLPVGALLGYITAENEPAPWESVPPVTSPSSAEPSVANPKAKALPPAAGPAVRRMARQLGVPIESIIGSGPAGRIMPGDLREAPAPVRVTTSTSRIIASPRARRVAEELGVDWPRLQGSGRNGRIREIDVRSASPSGPVPGPTSETPVFPGQRLPLTMRRRTIARRMVASLQQTASVTITSRVTVTSLIALRNQFKAAGAVVPAYTDLIAKLAADVLVQHPLLAGRWMDDHILVPLDDGYHIGIAVDTPDGLVVPVLRDVRNQSLPDLARTSRDLIDRARQGKATASELQGGVFTITNLGSFGIDAFTPLINLPETSILGLGAMRREPVVVDDRIEIHDQMTLSLTFDHRLVDGAPAARFLLDLRQAIEHCELHVPAA